VAQIVIPALRERPEDIEPLVEHFAQAITGEPGNPLAKSMGALRQHRWSGNARELRNVVESAIVMGRVELEGNQVAAGGTPSAELIPYRHARAEVLARFEAEYLGRLISECEGNASEAARRARMDRPYLLTLLRKHGLRR
jgi:DNA-binding NtrC family response regulator